MCSTLARVQGSLQICGVPRGRAEILEELRCCVCDVLLTESEARYIGSRSFCQKHFSRAIKASSSRWSRTGLPEILLNAAFVIFVALFFGGAHGELPTSIASGLALALFPAIVWMVYAYRQDRIEPEPWGAVVVVFLLGALLGHAVAVPVARDWFLIREWQHLSVTASTVAVVLVSGTLQQFCTYIVVRYTMYFTAEFDEPIDGIVYTTAAGLGLATVMNVDFVVRSEGVLPLAGATTIATTTLIHVAAAAILGHGLGRARFRAQRRDVVLAGAFALSVLANGGLKQLGTLAAIEGARFHPWIGLAVVGVASAIILVGIDILNARLVAESFTKPATQG